MKNFLRLGLVTASAVAIAPLATAGDYIVRIEGTVDMIEGAGATNAPFSSAMVGDTFSVDYSLFYPGTIDPMALLVNGAPVASANYEIDYAASSITFGGQTQPLVSTVPAGIEDGVSLLSGVNGCLGYTGVGMGFLSLSIFDLISPAGQTIPSNDLLQLVGTTIDLSQVAVSALIYSEMFSGPDSVLFRTDTITILDPSGGFIGTSYCQAAVNSTGVAATLSALGSILASDNSLTLTASGLPTNQFGIFLTSRMQGFSVGAGGTSNGNLCLGGTIGRFTGPGQLINSGGAGSISLALDLTALPQGAGSVAAMAGETWNFQAWFRDGVGQGSNFSEGLQVDFQ